MQTTRHELLNSLRECVLPAQWVEFLKIYTPALQAYFRKRDVSPTDAELLTEELCENMVMVGLKHYDPTRKFRYYLFGCAHHLLSNYLRGQRPDRASGSTDIQFILDQHPAADNELEMEFIESAFAYAIKQAKTEFRERDVRIFLQITEGNESYQSLADKLVLSPERIKKIMYTVRDRIKTLVKRYLDETM